MCVNLRATLWFIQACSLPRIHVLANRYLAMDVSAVLHGQHTSGVQASCHNMFRSTLNYLHIISNSSVKFGFLIHWKFSFSWVGFLVEKCILPELCDLFQIDIISTISLFFNMSHAFQSCNAILKFPPHINGPAITFRNSVVRSYCHFQE
jgi:hypothetical protein